MPRPSQRKTCIVCGTHVDECGALSSRNKCQDCARQRIYDNIIQLNEHGGYYFDNWRRRHAAAVGGILVDDLIQGGQ